MKTLLHFACRALQFGTILVLLVTFEYHIILISCNKHIDISLISYNNLTYIKNNSAFVSCKLNQSAFNFFIASELTLAHTSIDPMSLTTESSSSSTAFHLPAQVISNKLDGTNFLAWSAQLLLLFRSYGLIGIVDGSEPNRPQFTSTEHKNQFILNFGYVVWQYKDQTILGWIISSLSPAVVSTIYDLETSRLAWQALGARFAAPSTSRISLIKRKLQSLQQGFMQCQ